MALIQPLAWELPCAVGVALEKKEKKKKRKRKDWKGENVLSLVVFPVYLHVMVRTLFIPCVTLLNKMITEARNAKKSVKST